ncbi:MAG: hypothetical protein IKF17_01000 [Clostridia bacterium]|nr:hypothetical protein [Clostridia bacterium]
MPVKKKIAIGLCVLAVIVLAFIGGNVLAKYQSQVKGQGIADVAKWVFNVNGNSSAIQTIAINKSYDQSTLTNGKIAPGTQGTFDIIIDATGSEVGVDYTVAFLNEKNKPTNLKFKYENEEFSSLQDLQENLTGTIDANEDNKKKTLTISWLWNYETGDANQISTNDKIDTDDGTKDLDYTFDVVVTGTQVTPQ